VENAMTKKENMLTKMNSTTLSRVILVVFLSGIFFGAE